MDTAASYRQHWAALTGRPESDVYVPEALRDTAPLSVVLNVDAPTSTSEQSDPA